MSDIRQVTPAEANAILRKDENAIYLDVRTEEEFTAGHPEGALNIPILFLGGQGPRPNPDFLPVAEKALPRDKLILCGCKSGGRSQRAAEALRASGYQNVVNVDGGFAGRRDAGGNTVVAGWAESGLPVTAGEPAGATYGYLKNQAGR